MQAEIEAKFLDIDIEKMRGQLLTAGAVCRQPMRLMRRAIIETPEMKRKDAYVRVRDEGDKVTLTYKQFDELSIDGAKEVGTVVGDFDATVALLAQAGLKYHSLQESKRETWQLGDVEVVIDEWPWLDIYIEIEGKSEQALQGTVKKLGLDWKDAVFGDVMVAYRAQYPHLRETDTVGRITEVRFADPLPTLLKTNMEVGGEQ
ncbi:MAG TPA: CYTH domain-containing protein [Candidatus Saccharimonadales bacterium]|jgi:adenylate cyclase class 2